MITAIVLVAGPVVFGVLAARFGADSRDRRWSITGPPPAVAAAVHGAAQPAAPIGPHPS